MPQLVVVTREGQEIELDGKAGRSVMEALRNGGVEDILAICGGCCSCATCHVYVDPAFADLVGPPGADEADLLDCSDHRRPQSRLSCQIPFSDALAGLRVTVAPEE